MYQVASHLKYFICFAVAEFKGQVCINILSCWGQLWMDRGHGWGMGGEFAEKRVAQL